MRSKAETAVRGGLNVAKRRRVLEENLSRDAAVLGPFVEFEVSESARGVAKHALLQGIELTHSRRNQRLNDSMLPRVGDFVNLLHWENEKIYVWTPTEHKSSCFVSELQGASGSNTDPCRTVGACLGIAATLISLFEHSVPVDYVWITGFDQFRALRLQSYSDRFAEPWLGTRDTRSIAEWAEIAAVIELLLRDEKFYAAAQQLLTSFECHYFCLHCSLLTSGPRMHPNREPSSFQLAQLIPRMEAAIVLATRAVEGILGQPGARGSTNKVARMIDRWKTAVSLDPAAEYHLTPGRKHLDFYYELFNIRNYSAHSHGQLSRTLKRVMAIQAQTFAYLILYSYFEKQSVSVSDAQERLKFNKLLLKGSRRGG